MPPFQLLIILLSFPQPILLGRFHALFLVSLVFVLFPYFIYSLWPCLVVPLLFSLHMNISNALCHFMVFLICLTIIFFIVTLKLNFFVGRHRDGHAWLALWCRVSSRFSLSILRRWKSECVSFFSCELTYIS